VEDLFLTRDELIQLTGYRQRRRQVAWLQARGYTVEVNGRGAVLVLRDHVRHVLGGPGQDSAAEQPDFTALDKAGAG
jgi:hypothetical protein